MSLYKQYHDKIKHDLKRKLELKNIHQVPKIEKVIVSMWIWSLTTRKGIKDFSDLEDNLKKVTWQKPVIVKSKKSISNFKLREDMPVMIRVTLRGKKAYDFIERLVKMYLPRVRDFQWINPKKFDWKWNYSIWFDSQSIFAELTPEEIKTIHWVQINIVTSCSLDEQAKELFWHVGLIFQNL